MLKNENEIQKEGMDGKSGEGKDGSHSDKLQKKIQKLSYSAQKCSAKIQMIKAYKTSFASIFQSQK